MSEKVCIVGSGNWGTVVAKIVGLNVLTHQYDRDVVMWVHEEIVDGQKLSEIINKRHENIKYMPGLELPNNVRAEPDLIKAVQGCTVLVFVVPHQFIKQICQQIKGKVTAKRAISLVKGIDVSCSLKLVSQIIGEHLEIPVCVLMGANIASEVARELFCEATLGYPISDPDGPQILKPLFDTRYFRVTAVADVCGVELAGALKNIVALGAGFSDGLGYGDNTKAAIIRIGLAEMLRFAQRYYPSVRVSTFFESCGVADLITTCYGGRNRRVAEAMVKTGKSLEELEDELLSGQKLQGTLAAKEVHRVLCADGVEAEFPLFTTIYGISFQGVDPARIVIDI